MIRKAKLYDIPMINELGTVINKKFTDYFKMNEIINEPISLVIVYEEDANVIGFLHATVLYEIVDIINIVVDHKHRRQKVASSLIDYLLSELTTDVKLMTLEVNVNNHGAIKLYELFGFEIVNKRNNYYGDQDAYVMGRKIG